ncbi:MAG: response regulator, partial [Nitrospirae bacterium]|nr:response regulator [Nitrospirota bacterium]
MPNMFLIAAFWEAVILLVVWVPLVLLWLSALLDLFLRQHMSGIARVLWLLLIIFLPVIGAIIYFIVRSRDDIDVIIADHRMPHMTGVEVLTAVRTLSPRTVRILLTGYADLDAVEGSINHSEVFRFLTKPCAPDQLRETIELAATISRETAASVMVMEEIDETTPIGAPSDDIAEKTTPESESAEPTISLAELEHQKTVSLNQVSVASPETVTPQTGGGRAGDGIAVFSDDDDVLEAVQKAGRGRVPIYHARNIIKVIKILTEHRPGVLVTDISEDKGTIQSMTAQLKKHLPELVTIAISEHRDVLDMVWLINHGQIFRFLRKPLSPGRCAISLQSALQHHRLLLKNPDL